MEYLERARFYNPDLNSRGAEYKYSLYWFFLERETYESVKFSYFLKLGLVGLNVYYFFIRRNPLFRCLSNIFSFQTQKMTARDQRKTIEILTIQYVGGLIFFIPGGHFQFQLWYQELVPLLLMMSGFPVLGCFNLYRDMIPNPSHEVNISHHQIFIGLLMLWMLTVGPWETYPSKSVPAVKKLKQD